MAIVRKSWKEKVISKAAERMVMTINEPPANAPVKKSLNQSVVAFVTTSGVHLKADQPFNIKGDHTCRMIPGTSSMHALTITHTHYDTSEAFKDINVVFPLQRLKDLAKEGKIKAVAPHHFGLMGYIPATDLLINETAPMIADTLEADGVDICLLSPG